MANMKITYIYTALTTIGGVDRILSVKANYFADVLNYDVYIITDSQAGRPIVFPLSDRVHHIDLDIDFGEQYKYNTFKRYLCYRKLMKKYKFRLTETLKQIKSDFVITTCGRDMDFITKIQDGSIKIGESHISRHYVRNFHLLENKGFPYNCIVKYWRFRQDNAVRKLDAFVVLTNHDAQSWQKVRKAIVIPNPLTFVPTIQSDCKSRKIISVGRLNEQKGFDRLIEIWSLIAPRHKDWTIEIYGNGELQDNLNSLVTKYKVADSFHICSPTYNIIEKYCESSIYVMSSKFEGFGLVLTEAMACGIPCISFDCPYGPSEIIHDGVDGFLINNGDINTFAKKLEYLMENPEIRKQMGMKALTGIKKYEQNNIMKLWTNLFHVLKP